MNCIAACIYAGDILAASEDLLKRSWRHKGTVLVRLERHKASTEAKMLLSGRLSKVGN